LCFKKKCKGVSSALIPLSYIQGDDKKGDKKLKRKKKKPKAEGNVKIIDEEEGCEGLALGKSSHSHGKYHTKSSCSMAVAGILPWQSAENNHALMNVHPVALSGDSFLRS
jgi:hypothetical protein